MRANQDHGSRRESEDPDRARSTALPAVQKGLRLVELTRDRSTLEEVFRRLTQEPPHAAS